MAVHQVNPQGSKLAALDPIWDRVRGEAEDIVRREPELASFIYSTVLHHERLEDSVVHRLAERLDHSALSGDLIRQTYDEALGETMHHRIFEALVMQHGRIDKGRELGLAADDVLRLAPDAIPDRIECGELRTLRTDLMDCHGCSRKFACLIDIIARRADYCPGQALTK